MGIGVCVPIYTDEKPTVLKSGNWFCYGCKRLRKTINYPFTGTINCACKKCGSTVVFKQE